jgi:hypothetical protein
VIASNDDPAWFAASVTRAWARLSPATARARKLSDCSARVLKISSWHWRMQSHTKQHTTTDREAVSACQGRAALAAKVPPHGCAAPQSSTVSMQTVYRKVANFG